MWYYSKDYLKDATEVRADMYGYSNNVVCVWGEPICVYSDTN